MIVVSRVDYLVISDHIDSSLSDELSRAWSDGHGQAPPIVKGHLEEEESRELSTTTGRAVVRKDISVAYHRNMSDDFLAYLDWDRPPPNMYTDLM